MLEIKTKKKWGDPAETNPHGGWCEGMSAYDPEDTWIHRLYVVAEWLAGLVVLGLVLWFLTSLGK